MGFRPTFSKGRNNVFFQVTSGPADQAEAPPKGNLLGVGDQKPVKGPKFGKGFAGQVNQGVNRANQPPPVSQGGYFTYSRPYQANWGLKSGLAARQTWRLNDGVPRRPNR